MKKLILLLFLSFTACSGNQQVGIVELPNISAPNAFSIFDESPEVQLYQGEKNVSDYNGDGLLWVKNKSTNLARIAINPNMFGDHFTVEDAKLNPLDSGKSAFILVNMLDSSNTSVFGLYKIGLEQPTFSQLFTTQDSNILEILPSSLVVDSAKRVVLFQGVSHTDVTPKQATDGVEQIPVVNIFEIKLDDRSGSQILKPVALHAEYMKKWEAQLTQLEILNQKLTHRIIIAATQPEYALRFPLNTSAYTVQGSTHHKKASKYAWDLNWGVTPNAELTKDIDVGVAKLTQKQ